MPINSSKDKKGLVSLKILFEFESEMHYYNPQTRLIGLLHPQDLKL